MFYIIFPAALPLFGFSFIFSTGVLGLFLYVYNKYPFNEVIQIVLFFMAMIGWALFCTFINNTTDNYAIAYTKSQIAWIFSAYLFIYLFFKIHPKASFHLLLYYLIAAITLQGVISVAMYLNADIARFFESLQLNTEFSDAKRAMTEGKRLLGYGVAFFGSGIVMGLSLILIVYVFMSKKMNMLEQMLWAILYVATFLVGLFSARTTIVGLLASMVLFVIFIFKGSSNYKSQGISILFYSVVFSLIGYTLVWNFFEDFADWAFEPFLNYQETGEFRTSSSDGLMLMLRFPTSVFQWIFGNGVGDFSGSDVGYTRLLFWFGLPGTIMFFAYGYLLIRPGLSSNKMLNIMFLVVIAYNMAINIKGLSDLNQFLLFFTMYFLYYKYYIYTPYLYRIGKVRQTSLRYAVQSSTSGRRF